MKKLISIVVLFCIAAGARATECADRFFKEDKINLYLCQNYSNYNETRALLFKARTKVLNEYITEQIKNGRLQDKKFEVQVYDQVLTYRHLELTQGKNGYYIDVSGFPTMPQLLAFVEYFAKPGWKPFVTASYEQATNETRSRQIDHFFAENHVATMTAAMQKTFPVWTLGELHLDYLGDSLKYFIGTTALPVLANSSLPVKIRDRFLLFQRDSIFVLQGKEIIKQLKIDDPISGDYDIHTSNNWVNICDGGEDNWVFSYSYERNKFYKRKVEN